MDEPPSEGNERVADIFIASTDRTVTALLSEHLERNNHPVSVFTDDRQLNDTILTRKPNLLIYDGTTGGPERYAAIHRIKVDPDLWRIPVLVLTAASTMDDLLQVLESNADNFITPPYDLPDHLSLVEGMLVTPLERPTPEDLKKQFKVRQDDQTYVIDAPRRKLLEYLLSSFETMVSSSSGLSCANSKILELTESERKLEQAISGKNRDIETLNASARQNEEKIAALREECKELRKTLTQKTDEIKNLVTELDTKKTSLDTVENALNEEETRNATLKKELHDHTLELEQLQSALVAEKNRSLTAQQEINTLMQVKTQSERELNQIITGLNEDAQQQAAELARVRSEMEAETRRRGLAENRADEHQREFEQSTNTHQSETDALNQQVRKLQENLAATATALETEREMRRVSEEQANAAARQQEDLKTQNRITYEELERAKTDQAATIGQMKEELKLSGQQVQSLQADVSTLTQDKLHAEQEVRKLTTELEDTKIALNNERKRHVGIDEGTTDAGSKRHLVQQPLFSPDDVTAPEEGPCLVVPEKSHLPIPVDPVSLPVIREMTPGPRQPPVPKKDPVPDESSGEVPRIFSGIIPRVPGISDADSIFVEPEPAVQNVGPAPGPVKVNKPSEEKTFRDDSPAESAASQDQKKHPASDSDAKPEKETQELPGRPGSETGTGRQPGETPKESGGTTPQEDLSFNSTQWLDLLKWAHHSDALSKDQRLRIVRMGRLIQKDRKLTKKQQEQVREILSSAAALGYRSP